MPKIFRVLKDYDLPTSTPPPNPEDAKLYKNDLVRVIQPPSGGWVLVRKLLYCSTLPGLVPEDYIAKAKPGFYRAKRDIYGGNIKVAVEGTVIQVTNVKPSFFNLSAGSGYWKYRYPDGSNVGYCLPWMLEAIDVPTDTQALMRVFALSGRKLDLKRLLPTLFRNLGGPDLPVGKSEAAPPPYSPAN